MTKTRLKKATKTVYTILKQITRWIPRDLVKSAAERHGIRYRTFDPWSHLVTLLMVQLSREESLNGICDIAQAMSYEWDRAGMEIPRRNTLSNANKKRDPAMAEDVFWGLFRHLGALEPDFVSKGYSGYLARIRKHRLYALDSSTIRLVLNCIDWARHRRRKAAAKLHMLLDVSSRLPAFAVVEEASYQQIVCPFMHRMDGQIKKTPWRRSLIRRLAVVISSGWTFSESCAQAMVPIGRTSDTLKPFKRTALVLLLLQTLFIGFSPGCNGPCRIWVN